MCIICADPLNPAELGIISSSAHFSFPEQQVVTKLGVHPKILEGWRSSGKRWLLFFLFLVLIKKLFVFSKISSPLFFFFFTRLLGKKCFISLVFPYFLRLLVVGRCCPVSVCVSFVKWLHLVVFLPCLFSNEKGSGFIKWTLSSTCCCGWRCGWDGDFGRGRKKGGSRTPFQPPDLPAASASSQLPVQCLRLMPCSGKLRLHAKLCSLLFY